MPMLGGQSTQQWEIQGPLVVLAQPSTGYGHIGFCPKTWEVPVACSRGPRGYREEEFQAGLWLLPSEYGMGGIRAGRGTQEISPQRGEDISSVTHLFRWYQDLSLQPVQHPSLGLLQVCCYVFMHSACLTSPIPPHPASMAETRRTLKMAVTNGFTPPLLRHSLLGCPQKRLSGPGSKRQGGFWSTALRSPCIWHILNSLPGEGANTTYSEDNLHCGLSLNSPPPTTSEAWQ